MGANDLLGTLEAAYAVGIGLTDATTARTATLLQSAVTAVSERLADACGTIIYGTVTGELHDGGCSSIYLDHQPIQGVVQVVEYDSTTAATLTAETNATKTSTNYWLDPENGKIVRRDTNMDAWFPAGRDNVLVTYVVGRFSSTSTVSSKFKEAAAITLKNMWRTYESAATQVSEFDVPQASFPKFTIPNAVKDLLAREWRSGSGFGD